jgi:MSHA pilin protein MshD
MSLIEVVIFIVVLGIGFTGLLVLYNQVTRASVDPLVRKQALAIAASLLEEIELRSFTYCDPDDANVFTAAGPGACTTAEGPGPEGETRYGPAFFDNVSDYHNFSMGFGQVDPNIRTIDGTAIPDLADYSVVVAVQNLAGGELPAVASSADGLRISVTAAHVPTGVTVVLQGYRLRYAPNSP